MTMTLICAYLIGMFACTVALGIIGRAAGWNWSQAPTNSAIFVVVFWPLTMPAHLAWYLGRWISSS